MTTIDPEVLLRQTGWLRGLARGLLDDPQRVDDAVQEALLAALEHPPARTSDERSLRAWLARVLRNRLHSRARTDGRRADRERRVARGEAVPSVAESLERVSLQKELVDAVCALDSPYREVVVLRYFEDLDARQIAARLGSTPGAVRTRLSRALATLRARLDDRHDGDRARWAFALLPLAATRPATTGAKVVAGLVAASVVAGALALRVLAGGVEPERVGEVDASSAELARVVEVGDDREVALASQPTGRVAQRTERAEPVSSSIAEEVVEITARVVDTDGRPLEGVELFFPRIGALRRWTEELPTATSDADGDIELDVPWTRLEGLAPSACPIVFRGAGLATTGKALAFWKPEPVHLGTITLAPGGAIEGRVVDERGAPVHGAVVFPAPPVTADDLARRTALRTFGARVLSMVAETDAGGRYRLEGVPVTLASVGARGDATLFGYSEPVTVLAGETVIAGDAVLVEPASGERIAGVVLGLSGEPLEHVRVRLRDAPGGNTLGTQTFTDASGRFTLVVERGRTYTVAAETRRLGEVANEIEPGTLDAVLAFEEPESLVIRVHGVRGETLRRLYAFTSTPDGQGLPASAQSEDGETLKLEVPDVLFEVRVLAEGHAPGRLGPFEPGSFPGEVELALERAFGITGRVLAGGEPVAGAFVDGHFEIPGSPLARFEDGFFTRVDSMMALVSETDADGRYFLDMRRGAGRVFVHARAAGHGTSELVAVDYTPAAGDRVLDLVLPATGVLEGRVLVPDGSDPRAVGVGASQADGHVRTTTVDADGRYRFDALAPGGWQVRPTRIEPEDRYESSVEHVDGPLTWDVQVAAGRTTRFDLDLRQVAEARLDARFTLDGAAAAGWTWRFHRLRDQDRQVFDAAGRFTFRFAEPREDWILVESPLDERVRAVFREGVDLAAGANTWARDVETGFVELSGLTAESTREAAWVLSWRSDGLSFQARIHGGDDGFLRVRVPAGKVHLTNQVWRWTGDPDGEPALERDLVVRPGETTSVQLP